MEGSSNAVKGSGRVFKRRESCVEVSEDLPSSTPPRLHIDYATKKNLVSVTGGVKKSLSTLKNKKCSKKHTNQI